MNTLLPPEPLSKRRSSTVIIVVCLALLVVVASGLLAVRSIVRTGITKVPDDLFGDQYLKTAVALVELHKVRSGKYPDSLSNIRYIGQLTPLRGRASVTIQMRIGRNITSRLNEVGSASRT